MKYIKKNLSILLISLLVISMMMHQQFSENNSVTALSKYKVTFKVNGGKFTSSKYTKKKAYSKQIKYGKKIGKLPKITKKGHKLKGWYTKKASGRKATSKSKVKKNTTLYARWTPKTYNVFLDDTEAFVDSEGETISSSKWPIKYGSKFGEIASPGGGRENKVFVGWFTQKKGGTQIFSYTKFRYTKDITLYARYQDI